MMWRTNIAARKTANDMKLIKPFTAVIACVIVMAAAAFGQGGIKGRVRNADGKGIPNAVIALRQNGKEIKTGKADKNGSFQITGVAKGKYNVTFDADGYSEGVLYDVEITDKIRELPDRLVLSIDRGTLVIVAGSVFFKQGASATGAKVQIDEVRPDGSTKKLGEGFSNSTGEFSFRQPPRAAKLRVTAKYKNATAVKEIEVSEPAIYRVSLILDLTRQEK